MLLRALPLLLLAQAGIFGPVHVHPKAGDVAPEIVFQKTLSAGSDAPWSLAGKMTVIAVFPDTSHNPQSVSRWNSLVDQFAGKPIQFVWITGEKESSLAPWIAAHPIKGWVFQDPEGATGRAYGMELPAAVIVANDGRIVGFDRMMVPSANTLEAVFEGRITTRSPKPGNAAFKEFVENRLVLLDAESPRMPGANDHRPDFAPSYAVHISPAKSDDGGNFSSDSYWSLQNFELKDAVAELYDINPIRVHLPPALDDGKRYDFAIVLPQAESKESMRNRLRQGIEDQFHVSATREERLVDVYVVTALNGKPPEVKARPTGDLMFTRSATSSVEYQVTRGAPRAVSLGDIRGISLEGTMDEFCRTLERDLDRPVVNESNLSGDFVFRVKPGTGDFLGRLREQMNLDITPTERSVQVVVLRQKGHE